MDLEIENKVVLVSGGASGIGAGICRLLAMECVIPVIADRNEKLGKELVRNFKEQGKDAHYIYSDLGPAENCKNVVDEVMDKYGRLDALVNNAGENDMVGLEMGNPEDFLNSISENLLHYYSLTHYALAGLKKTQGSIVNISSKVAVTGQGNSSGYAASKGAQLALTRDWAVELLPYGIRVNAILPAEVMTPSYDKWLNKFSDPSKKLQDITKSIPLGERFTTVEEIASMAIFLISKKASHITGQYMFVDGGYVHLDRSLVGIKQNTGGH